MSRAYWHRLQRLGDHCIDALIFNRARSARTWRIQQTLHAKFNKTAPPLETVCCVTRRARCHHFVVQALCASEHDPRSQGEGLRCLATLGQRNQLLSLPVAPNTNGVFGLPLMATSSYNTLHD